MINYFDLKEADSFNWKPKSAKYRKLNVSAYA